MAKTTALGTDTIKEESLKEELQRLVKTICDEEDGEESSCSLETTDRALKTLVALREVKFNVSRNDSLGEKQKQNTTMFVPDEFKCPLSKKIMADPVVLSTGETYDRPYIEKWLRENQRTCPQTQQVLSHLILTPNHLVRALIVRWCNKHGMELPKATETLGTGLITSADRARLSLLLKKMSSSVDDQKAAAKEVRQLTKHIASFRSLIGDTENAIPRLLDPLVRGGLDTHPDLQEDLITTLLNISIQDKNKVIIGKSEEILSLLINSLSRGTISTRRNAAAALFSLSAIDSNKHEIGNRKVMKPLISLLDEGDPLTMRDAASAIFSLCTVSDNKRRAVDGGAVGVIMKKIIDGSLVDELLAILAMLSGQMKAVVEMGELGAVSCLLSIIKETKCEKNKENCVAILHSISNGDRSKLREMRHEEDANGTFTKLANSGTLRTKRKANGILERLNKVASVTHTA